MAKIFVDTNKYLDFYRYKEEKKEVLEKLCSCNNIIITKQVIDEFNRNRIFEINRLLSKIEEKGKNLNNGLCDLEPVGIFADEISKINSENSGHIREIKENYKKLKDEIDIILKDDSKDPVLETFYKIIDNKSTLIIEDSDEAYNLAIKRNKLGGIPRSDKNNYKYLTICDEYIWESLLLSANDDIVFVTKDRTYLDNSKLLAEEFRAKTGKTIVFNELVSSALKELGFKISKEAIEKEQQEQNDIKLLEKLSDITGIAVDNIYEELLTLTEMEEQVIKLRFGLVDNVHHTLDEVGMIFGVSRETIRQIEARALHKLRNRAIHDETIQDVVASL